MAIDILGAVIFTSVVQSMFGVGVLLFGTPILLVLGYDFVTTLVTLLPISLTINVIQVIKHHRHIDRRFYHRILMITVPGITVFLFLVTKVRVNITWVVGVFLIAVALKSVSSWASRAIDAFVRYEKSYLATMGVVHGLTNLGGSLLTAMVHGKNYEKDVARVTTAVAYGTFAFFQLLTLCLSLQADQWPPAKNLVYVAVGVGMFLITEQVVYAKLDSSRYRSIFAGFLFLSGLLLIGKAAFAQ